MEDVWPQLVLVGVLVLLNAAFAGSELALVSLREGQLQRLESSSATGAVLARLAREPNRFLATIQIGITLAGFLASASAAVALSEPLQEPLSFLGGWARPGSIFVVTLILSYITLVFGELAPKRIAMQRAERWGLAVARPLSAMATFTRPIVWFLSKSTDIVVRLLGADPNREREEVTQEELRELVAAQVTFTPQQRTIIQGAFEIAERSLRDILRPRPSVFVLDSELSCVDGLEALAASGHSRAPVAPGASLDDVVGVVHLRDLLGHSADRTVGSVAPPPMVFPETAGALDVLRQMQTQHTQLAVVIDEHGAAEGIITVEDLVEELVGEIYDETDRDVLSVGRNADGSFVVPGRFPVHDLPDLGIEISDGPYTTVSGLVLTHLQRIPDTPGDVVIIGPWRFTVRGTDERVVTEVLVEPYHPDDSPDDEDD